MAGNRRAMERDFAQLRLQDQPHMRKRRRSSAEKHERSMEMTRGGRFLVKQFIRRNTTYLKRTSSGKDLVIYCGQTPHQWDSDPSKVIGGSEEAVINLARELAKLSWNITVYNNCGVQPEGRRSKQAVAFALHRRSCVPNNMAGSPLNPSPNSRVRAP